MLKILVSGGDSKFAKELAKINKDIKLANHYEMDILDPLQLNFMLSITRPDVFIHTAAISRPMNRADTNPAESIRTNIIGTANCVIACMKYSVKFVYISTDYVYHGIDGNFDEKDPILPINKYAWSKLGGEAAAMLYPNSLIVRCAMMENPFPHEKALIDMYKSCIWMEDAAKKIMLLINKGETGIYNIGGECSSIYEFVHQKDNTILPLMRKEVLEKTPFDISLNTSKYDKLIQHS